MRVSRSSLGLAVGAVLVAITVAILLQRPAESERPAPNAEPAIRDVAPPAPGADTIRTDVTSEAPPDSKCVLEGTVVTAEGHEPVAGVGVELNPSKVDITTPDGNSRTWFTMPPGIESRSTTTDAAGKFEFELDVSFPVLALVVAAGPETLAGGLSHPQPLEPGEHRQVIIEVRAGDAVSGTVVDEHEVPVAGAAVRQTDDGALTFATTDAAGRFRIAPVVGRVHLEAAAPGRISINVVTAHVSKGKAVDGVILRLREAREVRGLIVGPDGAGVPGAKIVVTPQIVGAASEFDNDRRFGGNARSAQVVSAADGQFVVAAVAVGLCEFAVTHPGFAPWRGWRESDGGEVTIRLERRGSLLVSVLDGGGAGVPDADVTLWDGNRSRAARTDAEGHARFGDVDPAGPARVGVHARTFAVVVEDNVMVQSGRERVATIRVEPERAIAGTVVDEAGQAVENATVEIEGDRVIDQGLSRSFRIPTWERQFELDATRSAADGTFRLGSLYPGMFRITAKAPGSEAIRALATVASGTENLVLRFGVGPPGRLALVGSVRDSLSGEPVRRFTIVVMAPRPDGSESGEGGSVETADGTFRVDGIDPATTRVNVRADGYAPLAMPFPPGDPLERHLDIRLHPARSVRVRIVDRAGQIVPDATVGFRDESGATVLIQFPSGSGSVALDRTSVDQLDRAVLPAARLVARATLHPLAQHWDAPLDLRSPQLEPLTIVIDPPRRVPLEVRVFGGAFAVSGVAAPEAVAALVGSGRAWPIDAKATVSVTGSPLAFPLRAEIEPDGFGGFVRPGNSLDPGRAVGAVPIAMLDCPAGEYEVEASAAGYQSRTTTIGVAADAERAGPLVLVLPRDG